jgi:predicted DNA-binding antitoxin AbrB/MazE fold protein
MTKTLEATYDGEVLRPDEPLELEPQTRVQITIETIPEPKENSRSFLDVAASLNLDGPADWSENFEQYLYGNRNHVGE